MFPCSEVPLFSLSVMALKVAMAVGGTAKSVLRPALLCRPWEVRAGSEMQEQLQRSLGVLGPRFGLRWGLRLHNVLESDWLQAWGEGCALELIGRLRCQ